jgi:hypothetical protein
MDGKGRGGKKRVKGALGAYFPTSLGAVTLARFFEKSQ